MRSSITFPGDTTAQQPLDLLLPPSALVLAIDAPLMAVEIDG